MPGEKAGKSRKAYKQPRERWSHQESQRYRLDYQRPAAVFRWQRHRSNLYSRLRHDLDFGFSVH